MIWFDQSTVKNQCLQNICLDNDEEEISTTFKYDGKDYIIQYSRDEIDDEEKSMEELTADFRKYLEHFDLLMLIIDYENYTYLSNRFEYYAEHIHNDDQYGCY